jgi:mannose-6-phosphate isomerase-like protein (cupin superfamily)
MVQEGRSRLVSGQTIRDAEPGEIIVIKAGTPHGFVNIGPGILKQLDIHLSPRFKQENFEPTAASRRAGLTEATMATAEKGRSAPKN